MSRAVQQMFDGIAPTYDTLNRVLSLGIDRSWRRRAIAALGDVRDRPVLDVCAGTLDLAALAVDAGARVIATDFSHQMLVAGRDNKARDKVRVPLVRADALALPFGDGGFAGVICGFGLRNLDDTRAGLAEMRRLIVPGGKLVVLDFFRPRRTVTRAVQALYNQQILPLVGGAISGDRAAYRYLADSIERFAGRSEVEQMCREVGFASATSEDLTLGIASMVVASC
ncbi:MAG TPA: ubiquinone/menaquinone biosynthesis methyltransferase [Polyangia bacterium]|nr:ubiquinone/menaquinone biosynthesis methyltransferase [Polyangia bacterium]